MTEERTEGRDDGRLNEHVHDSGENRTECEHEHSGEGHSKHAHEHGEGSHEEHEHSGESHGEHEHCEESHADHEHVHGGEHHGGHAHAHSHTQTKAVLNRLSRAIGHLQSIRRMVEDGRDCSEVLIQLSAVRAALNSTGKIILQDHIEHCLVDAIESGDMQEIAELNKAIDQFLK